MSRQSNGPAAFPQLIVIADDLTGANDTGIAFAKAGLKTVVSILPSDMQTADPSIDVAVLSTHSRHLSAEAAQSKVTTALRPFCSAASNEPNSPNELPWIYKKIDSTLRGHPGPELLATMDVLGLDRALIAPAFPAQGRTTVAGQQLVHGMPLAESSFGKEVPESAVAQFFVERNAEHGVERVCLAAVRDGHEALAARFAQSAATLFVADAENDDDLHILAKAGVDSGIGLFCGSAGLANALTHVVDLQPRVTCTTASADQELRLGAAGPVVVVAGSRHPQTARQVETFCSSLGYEFAKHLRPESVGLDSIPQRNSLIDDELEVALTALAQNQHLVLSTADLDLKPLDGETIAERLGQWVKRLLVEKTERNLTLGGLILTGGDVAMAACISLGGSALRLHGEIEPGIPYGELLDGPYAGLSLVTKAGGFGSDAIFIKAVDCLEAAAE